MVAVQSNQLGNQADDVTAGENKSSLCAAVVPARNCEGMYTHTSIQRTINLSFISERPLLYTVVLP